MSSQINVVMVGPRGAGKTSILSVMLHDVQQFIQRMTANDSAFADLSVAPSIEAVGLAHETLKNGRQQLEKLAMAAQKTGASSTASVDMSEGMIMGDKTSRCTPVCFRMGRHETIVNFWDFPGGFYSQAYIDRNAERDFALISRESISQWEKTICNADVILLAVDASAQLGEEPLLKDKTYYERITHLIKESIDNSMTTLVFVPVKCEHLVIEPSYDEITEEITTPFSKAGCRALKREIEKLFPELVKYIQNPNVWHNVDAFFAPMITVGGIRCNGHEYNPDTCKGTIRFSPIVPAHYDRTPFRPQNCDKVFALCLLRAYKALVAEWMDNRTIWERFTGIFSNKTPFEAFFDRLSDSLHFKKMAASYFVENPSFLKAQGMNEVQAIMERWAEEDSPEDGCGTMNAVYWPTSIR